MSFLDENGLTYFYGKLKEKFIRTVNSEAPDANGNVTITNVATADNLTSPDAQASYGTFIYRTSGGSASLSSGEAQLVYIDGNIDIVGRVVEDFQITTTNDIITTYSADVWRSQIDEDGTYVFTYIRPTSSAAAASWTTSGTWSYDGSQISMSSFGLYPSNVIDPSISAVVSGSGITAATVVPSTFFSQIATDSVTTFQYVNYEDEQQQQQAGWQLNDEFITLNTYGITVTGTAVDGDTITITSIVGTPNSTLTVVYTAPQQGTINVATPTVFSATGFNQFDKNSMVLTNASFSDGKIIQNTGTYACYCHAKGGVDNGYVAYSESDAILNIGWCANIPTIGADVITTGQSVSDSLASIPFDDDGYVVVIASSTADICIHPKWSGSADTEYAAYVAPSTITIPTQDINNNDLPTATYGIPKIGAIADRINLDAGTYIQKIGRLENNSSNMSYVVSIGVAYDYDDNYIYYVLPNTITYNIDIDPIYTVNDWGTEEFLGTTIPLSAQLLYGQNLRDKLRTDVVTISEQSLTQNQKSQICTNIGAVKKIGDTMTGNLTINTIGPGVYAKTSLYSSGSLDIGTNANSVGFRCTDKNNNLVALFTDRYYKDASTDYAGAYISGSKLVNGSQVYNQLYLLVNSDGTRKITMTDPAVWRTELKVYANSDLGTIIPNNANIASYTTVGRYYCPNSTVAKTLTNLPSAMLKVGFRMEVTRAGGIYRRTIYLGQDQNPDIWVQNFSSASSYSSWKKVTYDISVPVSIANGGTGGTTAESAKANLGLGTAEQNIQFAVPGTSNQHVSLKFVNRNSSNSHYNHTMQLVPTDSGIFLYDSTTSSSVWSIGLPVSIANGGTGMTAVSTESTTTNVLTPASGFSVTSMAYKAWGKVAMLSIGIKKTDAASAASYVMGTLVSAKRPATVAMLSTSSGNVNFGWIDSNGTLNMNGSWTANETKYFQATYLLS